MPKRVLVFTLHHVRNQRLRSTENSRETVFIASPNHVPVVMLELYSPNCWTWRFRFDSHVTKNTICPCQSHIFLRYLFFLSSILFTWTFLNVKQTPTFTLQRFWRFDISFCYHPQPHHVKRTPSLALYHLTVDLRLCSSSLWSPNGSEVKLTLFFKMTRCLPQKWWTWMVSEETEESPSFVVYVYIYKLFFFWRMKLCGEIYQGRRYNRRIDWEFSSG